MVADGAQPRQVVHIAGERGHFRHRHLGVQSGEAVAGPLLAGEHLHPLGVQTQQTRRQLLSGMTARDGGVAWVGGYCRVVGLGGVALLGKARRRLGGACRDVGRGQVFGRGVLNIKLQ